MYIHKILFVLISLVLTSFSVENHDYVFSAEEAIHKVNKLRAEGCYCGSEFMAPAKPIKWNQTLFQSALAHAMEMDAYNFFSHYGRKGEDIGTRLDQFNYPWEVAGENLGHGQRTFDEVMRDWKLSESHCRMLMNPRVTEMAVAKYKAYWVQHFGKKLPENAVPHPTN